MSQEEPSSQGFTGFGGGSEPNAEPTIDPSQLLHLSDELGELQFSSERPFGSGVTNANSSLGSSTANDSLFFGSDANAESFLAINAQLTSFEVRIGAIEARIEALAQNVHAMSQALRDWRNESWRAESAIYRVYQAIDAMVRSFPQQQAEEPAEYEQDFDTAAAPETVGDCCEDS